MLDLLAQTRLRLGDAPRRVRSDSVRAAPPWVATSGPEAARLGGHLFSEGHLVSAVAVNVSSSLFSPGDVEGFAVVVHPSVRHPVSVEHLGTMAGALGNLESRNPADPAQARLKQLLAAGTALVKESVPVALAHGVNAYVSMVPVHPRDLPGGCMRTWFLPVLVHDENPAVLVLPRTLWAPDLVAAWADLGAERLVGPPA